MQIAVISYNCLHVSVCSLFPLLRYCLLHRRSYSVFGGCNLLVNFRHAFEFNLSKSVNQVLTVCGKSTEYP
jgi:hypothetical protein